MGPVIQNNDLRSLPYVAPNTEIEEKRLTRYPHPGNSKPDQSIRLSAIRDVSEAKSHRPRRRCLRRLLTFDGMNSSQSGCMLLPPDTDGDVGAESLGPVGQ